VAHVLYLLQRQRSALLAVIYREATTRFIASPFGLVGEIARIVLTVAIFTFLRAFAGIPSHHGMDLLPFMVTGVMTLWVMRTALMQAASYPSVARQYALFPHVTPLDVALGRAIVNCIFLIIVSVTAFGLMILFGYSRPVDDLPYVVWIFLVAGFFGAALGLTTGAIAVFFPFFRILIGFLFRLMMYTGGVFFVIPEVPLRFRPYALYNPLLHLNDMIREAYFASYHATQASSSYVAVWIFFSVFVGLAAERALRPYRPT
jgi:capsular polysaccharide transport system permease protein